MATTPNRILASQKTFVTATITTAADGLSDVIDLGGASLNSIQMSTAWTTANLTFNGAVSSSASLQTIRHTTASLELTYVTTINYSLTPDPYLFSGIRYLQLRSGSTTTPVAQVAARPIVLGLTPINPIK